MHTVNIRVTHHRADVPTLETFSFPDIKKAMEDITAIRSVKECVIIQTCNRVEIFAAAEDIEVAYHDIVDYIMQDVINRMKDKHKNMGQIDNEVLVSRMIEYGSKIHDIMEVDYHIPALKHLLRLTGGLESMIVGEDQILGQVKDSYQMASGIGAVGPFFKNIFSKAINVGKVVRTTTDINKGAVSIGSAAVELGESIFGSLEGKKIMLVGAGEMGTLIAKSLSEYCLGGTCVVNRTMEKGIKLAEELKGEAIEFDRLKEALANSDLVITATGSPTAIIDKGMVEEAIKGKESQLVIIDVANPRDVEPDVDEIEGVSLFNIDGLRIVADKNKKQREKEISKVEKIIEAEIDLLIKQVYRIDVQEIIKMLYNRAEDIRRCELERAQNMLGNQFGEREKTIVNDLTKVIIKKTIAPIADNIRKSAETGDKESIEMAEKWFYDAFKDEDFAN